MLQNKIIMIHFKFGLLTIFLMLSWNLHANADAPEYQPVLSQIKQCVSCHGENGATLQPTFPILSGQHFYYLYVQLKDFKSGYRENEIMWPLVSVMEKEQMQLIAKYYSEQKWPDSNHKAMTDNVKLGKQVIDAGQCVACHLGAFNGNSRVPRLANQHIDYLNKTMLDFKNKVRTNSPAKGSLFATFSDEEIKAVADYLTEYLAGSNIISLQFHMKFARVSLQLPNRQMTLG